MELNQLRYLVKLSEIQNFSKAAEVLFITQPTLSQQIGRLEQELGVKLFERSTRKVVLTEVGNSCALCAKKALEQIDEMVAVAERYSRSEDSKLLVGILIVLPQLDITNVIASFREEYPEIGIELLFGWSTDLVHMLLHNKLDVIISNIYFSDEDSTADNLDIIPFLEDRLVVAVSKKSKYAACKSIELKEFINERFWVVDSHSSVKIEIERRIRDCGFPLPEFRECSSMASVMKTVASNLGISVMSTGVAKEYRLPDVKIIPITPKVKTSTAIVTLKNKKVFYQLNQFIKYFLKEIKER